MAKEQTARVSDASLLAALQLVQPATAKEALEFVGDSEWASTLTEKRVDSRLTELCMAGFVSETGDKRYVLTPLGSALAATSMKPKDRDKFRLLILNSSRHTKQLRWMHR